MSSKLKTFNLLLQCPNWYKKGTVCCPFYFLACSGNKGEEVNFIHSQIFEVKSALNPISRGLSVFISGQHINALFRQKLHSGQRAYLVPIKEMLQADKREENLLLSRQFK